MTEENKAPEVIVTPSPDNTQKVVVEVKQTTVEKPAEKQPTPQKNSLVQAISISIRSIFAVILFPFKSFRGKASADEVTVYSATPGFFVWLLIFVGFLFSALVRWNPDISGTLGWIYTWTIIYFLASLLYDISAKRLALWVIVFLAVWFGLKYVEHVQNWMILGGITKHLASLEPKYDPGFGSFIAWILIIPFSYSLFHLFANGRKRFAPNEIGEFHFLDGDEMTDRMGLRFRTKYRDVLETLLTFGGGDIIATDNHQNEIKRYPNILCLWFKWARMDKVLNQRSVVEDASPPSQ